MGSTKPSSSVARPILPRINPNQTAIPHTNLHGITHFVQQVQHLNSQDTTPQPIINIQINDDARSEQTPINADSETPAKRSRGRPKGSRNKNKQLAEDEPKTEREGRGKSFSSQEVLILAKAWIFQTSKGPNQRDEDFWNGIRTYCIKNGSNRSPISYKSMWRRLRRQSLIYLTCKEEAKGKKTFRTNCHSIDDYVMKLYREKAGKVDMEGVFHHATTFSFKEAAEYLQSQPRFQEEMFNENRQSNNNSVKDDTIKPCPPNQVSTIAADDDDRDITCVEASDDNEDEIQETQGITKQEQLHENLTYKRPLGVKKRRLSEDAHTNHDVLENILMEMSCVIKSVSNEIRSEREEFKQMIERQEDLRLLEILPTGSKEHQEILVSVLEHRKRRSRSENDHERADGSDIQ